MCLWPFIRSEPLGQRDVSITDGDGVLAAPWGGYASGTVAISGASAFRVPPDSSSTCVISEAAACLEVRIMERAEDRDDLPQIYVPLAILLKVKSQTTEFVRIFATLKTNIAIVALFARAEIAPATGNGCDMRGARSQYRRGSRGLKYSGGKLTQSVKWLGITMVCLSMASCTSTQSKTNSKRSKEYFSEKEYGVKASPRMVSEGKRVPKGGGRYMVGKPYTVKGKTYVPKEDPNYNKTGLASWYGAAFHGRLTANGEVYDKGHLSAAHPTFPLPSYARVTNVDTGTSVVVRVNDRGPFHPGRIIDVSAKTAELLDMKQTGTAKVNVQYVGRARMDGHDMPYLMASYIRKGERLPTVAPEGQIATGVMVASNEPLADQMQRYDISVPTPIALNGSTPSGPQAPATEAFEALGVLVEFTALPAIGPVPALRPTYDLAAIGNGSLSSGYVMEPVQTVDLVFDAVMVRNDGLTEGSIQSYAQREQVKKAKQ